MELKKSHFVGSIGWILNILYWGYEAIEHGLAYIGGHFWSLLTEHLVIVFQIPLFMFVGYLIKNLEEEIVKRNKSEESVQKAYDDLEIKVEERTKDLSKANEQLQKDIIERERAEEALLKSEEKYRSFFDHDLTGDFISTPDGQLIDCNPAFFQIFGFPEVDEVDSEDLARSLELKSLYPSPEKFEEMVDRVRGEKKIVNYEHEMRKVGGDTIFVNENAVGEFNENGKLIKMRGYIIEISERKKGEEELKKYSVDLEESNRLKDLFIDIMRHDLLNPATSSRNMAELVLIDEKDPKKNEMLKVLLHSNNRMIDMIQNASLLAKLGSREKLELEKTELGTILKNAVDDMDFLANEKDMKINLNADGEFIASANPLVYDVFSNLISNAIKHGPVKSEVTIEILEEGSDWIISVADQGDGVPDEYKENIFYRFRRLEKEGVKGTGLGLAIVKMVVNAHGGRVWVEDNPDGGSIFCVTLPKK